MSLFKKKEKEKTAGEWVFLGANAEDPEKKLEYYTKALEIDPEYVSVWGLKGDTFSELGRYDEAIMCFNTALELDPENGDAWMAKGKVLHELGMYDEAIICFDKSLQIKPDSAYAWQNKGYALHELGKYDDAIACFDAEIKIYPENDDAWHLKGNSLIYLHRSNEAIICFNTALEIDPNNEFARNSREHAVRELKEENIDEKILEGSPAEDYLARVNLELFEEGMDFLEGDPIEAINVFEKRIDEYPSESILWYFMGKAYAKIGDDIKSLEYYDKAIELEPQNFLAWKEKGLLLSNKNPHEAIKCFDKSIELYGDAQFWFYKGLVLASYLGEHEDAIHCLSKALETEYEFIQEWHYAAWYQRGVSLYELDEYEEAIVCFDKAIEIDPNMEEAWTGKGKSLLKRGKTDESDECLYFINKIRESKPESHEEGGTNEETIRKRISTINSEINRLAKERSEKFGDAGELAYSECIENAPELAPDAQTELDDILAIDTLISKTNQEMEKAKGGEKKTGFLAKLGDKVSSVAKQGKLKVELYNLERKKNSAITDFGEALWESHNSGTALYRSYQIFGRQSKISNSKSIKTKKKLII
ncbi:MAG: tetratricopeptide repeat protein [Methanosarcinales archaeon]|nr:MAG: tetratricopeptide repeat protein [Methanosarcinales archaeon]